MERKLEAFEVWRWRRMVRVSWMERRTNYSIFEEVGKETRLLGLQMSLMSHVMRREKLENLSLTGKISGERGRGRPRMKYMVVLRWQWEEDWGPERCCRWRETEKSGNPWSPASSRIRNFGKKMVSCSVSNNFQPLNSPEQKLADFLVIKRTAEVKCRIR